MKIKCSKCGKEFEIGNRDDGLPNGIGLPLEDGRIINVCTECIIGTDPAELAKWAEVVRDGKE